jgi:hypothetical protein
MGHCIANDLIRAKMLTIVLKTPDASGRYFVKFYSK